MKMILKIPSVFYFNLANELHTLGSYCKCGILFVQAVYFKVIFILIFFSGNSYESLLLIMKLRNIWDKHFVMNTVECRFFCKVSTR